MSTMRIKKLRWFTILEITIVVIIIGIIITMIPLRMQSLRAHTDLSLVMQQREDLRQRSVTNMRQWPKYASATISVNTWIISVAYSWWNTDTLPLPEWTTILGQNLSRKITSYGVACSGPEKPFRISVWKFYACYHVNLNACALVSDMCRK